MKINISGKTPHLWYYVKQNVNVVKQWYTCTCTLYNLVFIMVYKSHLSNRYDSLLTQLLKEKERQSEFASFAPLSQLHPDLIYSYCSDVWCDCVAFQLGSVNSKRISLSDLD